MTHTRDIPGAPSSDDQGDCPNGVTGHLLFKALIPKLDNIAGLLNTQKQIQRVNQNGETKKHSPN